MNRIVEYVEQHLQWELKEVTGTLIDKNDDTLTIEEKVLIYKYSEDGYESVNKFLRLNKGTKISEYGLLLSGVLNKIPVYEGFVYRSADLTTEQIKAYINAAKADVTIVEHAFLSTSKSIIVGHAFAGKCKFTIISKTGRLIEKWSKYGSLTSQNENEVLFLPNRIFKILSVTKNKENTFIILEEQ